MSGRLPDFVIIGAMKCATTSLHEQLALRSGLFMSTPKEPQFFSDDPQFERCIEWYASLFDGARDDQLCGESSTHYTMLPTYPRTVERMRRYLPEVKLIYVMRHPVDRIVSQYMHEWLRNEVRGPIDKVVRRHERFVQYSRYAMQIEPYRRAYGRQSVLPVFFERLIAFPNEELARTCRFIGDPTPTIPRWDHELAPRHVSLELFRKSTVRVFLLSLPGVQRVKNLLPQGLLNRLKRIWQLRERLRIPNGLRMELEAQLDEDLSRLGTWLGVELDCRSWRDLVLEKPLDWAEGRRAGA